LRGRRFGAEGRKGKKKKRRVPKRRGEAERGREGASARRSTGKVCMGERKGGETHPSLACLEKKKGKGGGRFLELGKTKGRARFAGKKGGGKKKGKGKSGPIESGKKKKGKKREEGKKFNLHRLITESTKVSKHILKRKGEKKGRKKKKKKGKGKNLLCGTCLRLSQ